VRLIRWTTEASDQLEAAVKRIQEDTPAAARNVAQAVIDRIEHLATFPGLGRPGEAKGTRELVSPPYVVVYRYTDEIVEILHIWHGAQDWR
jgi:plasmid stabilization system protein ParE